MSFNSFISAIFVIRCLFFLFTIFSLFSLERKYKYTLPIYKSLFLILNTLPTENVKFLIFSTNHFDICTCSTKRFRALVDVHVSFPGSIFLLIQFHLNTHNIYMIYYTCTLTNNVLFPFCLFLTFLMYFFYIVLGCHQHLSYYDNNSWTLVNV